MKLSHSDKELILVLGFVFVTLTGTLLLSRWFLYDDRGECLVQHRADVQETWFNGVTFVEQTVSRMVCDVWEHPEGQ